VSNQNFIHVINQVSLCRSLNVPMSRPPPLDALPREVVERIFFFTIDVGDPREPSFKGGRSVICKENAPVLLTRVCRSWRDLTLSTPDLWTRIDLRTASPVHSVPILVSSHDMTEPALAEFWRKHAAWRKKKTSLAQGIATLIDLFTRLSGHLPMELYARNTCLHWDRRTIQIFSRSLRRALDRCQLVSLEGSYGLSWNLFPRRCITSAARLVELRVGQWSDPFMRTVRIGTAVLNAPLLQRVNLTSEASYRQLLSSNLTHVVDANIAWIDGAEQPSILRLCENLATCMIEIGWGVSACTLASFTLPLLTSLTIVSSPGFAIASLLVSLDAPELRKLAIQYKQLGPADIDSTLAWTPVLLAGRSFANLRELSLAHPHLDIDLIDVLHTTSELERLDFFSECRDVSAFVSALVPRDGAPAESTICPKLRVLITNGCHVGQDLAACVTKRAGQLSGVRDTFSLFVDDACPDLSRADLEAMKNMAPNGAELTQGTTCPNVLVFHVSRLTFKPAWRLAD
jgi:hypothetical protein